MFLLADCSGNIVDANERAAIAYGYTREELIGLNLEDLQEKGSLYSLDSEMRMVRENNGHIFQTVNVRKDGTAFPVEISARYVELSDGRFYWATVS